MKSLPQSKQNGPSRLQKRTGRNKLSSTGAKNPCILMEYSLKINSEATSSYCLRSLGWKAKTEGFFTSVAQDRRFLTRIYQAYVFQNCTNPKRRVCDTFDETIDDLVSRCPVMTPNE